MHDRRHLTVLAVASLGLGSAYGCSSNGTSPSGAGGNGGASISSTSASTGANGGATSSGATSSSGAGGGATGSGGSTPCTTRIAYGDAWIHPANHPDPFDDVTGPVTWDGTCSDDGPNSFATLSNGWKPYFAGHGACLMAIDTTCPEAPACTTRITYGPAWIPAPNHPAQYDDVPGRVFWDRACVNQNGGSFATLSNGWAPHFNGKDACSLSFEYRGCGGLYPNPVLPQGCADPGVLRDGDHYVVVCTSGGAPNAFPIFTSTDLVSWTPSGTIFPAAQKPAWAIGDFWAPEVHHVGNHYVAYFSARHQDGRLSIGAATAPSATGPFQDLGQPLVHDTKMGMIDVSEFEDAGGQPYLVWKEDGNAVGKTTPIYGQALSPDGTALTGARTTLIQNDLGWEGGVVEGPWVVAKDGYYYLFYSGNAYYNGTYAVGVARATSPLGPYQKTGAPILTTNATWVGPGHCSVVDTPAGDTYMVYHAWQAGHVNGPGDARLMLVDAVLWDNGWPAVPEAPSVGSRPMP
ncbi:MAG: glycoside hydrolase family 43 protein [Minicystis sp.]